MHVFVGPGPLSRGVGRRETGGRRSIVVRSLFVLVKRFVAVLLQSSDFLPEYLILSAEFLVLVLHLLGDVLQSDIALDFPLFVRMQTGLKLCELCLLAFTKSALGGSVRSLAPVGSMRCEVYYLFCTRLLADDSSSCGDNQFMCENWTREDERDRLWGRLRQCWAPSAFGRALA